MRTYFSILLFLAVLVFSDKAQSVPQQDKAQIELKRIIDTAKANLFSSPAQASTLLKEAFLAAEKSGYKKLSYDAVYDLGTAYYLMGKFDSAGMYYIEAFNQSLATNDQEGIANGYNRMGLIYAIKEDYAASEESLQSGLKRASIISDTTLRCKLLLNLSITFDDWGQDSLALVQIDSAVDYAYSVGNTFFEAMSRNRKGYILSDLGLYKESIKSHKQALAVADADNKWEKCFGYAGLSRAFLAMEDTDSSIYYGEKGLVLGTDLGGLWELQQVTKYLSEAFLLKEDYNKAYHFHVLHKSYSDSVFNKEKNQELNEFLLNASQLENSQLELENRLSRSLAEDRRIIVVTLLILVAVLIGFLFFVYRSYQLKHHLNRNLMEKSQIISDQHQLLLLQDHKKDEILAVISHDMRSPISAMKSMIEILRMDVSTNDKYQKVLSDTEAYIDRLTRTLNDLLAWSKIQFSSSQDKLEKGQINEVATAVIKLLEGSARSKHISILHDSGAGDVSVYADFQKIRVIIRNLLNNAIKFTPEGGKIYIDYEPMGEYLRISLKDTGIGLDTEEIKALLSGTKRSTAGTKHEMGTGFGFDLCYRYSQSLGGTIEIESEKGIGSIFTLVLPLSKTEKSIQTVD
jgi:signal transduction histidine kinase